MTTSRHPANKPSNHFKYRMQLLALAEPFKPGACKVNGFTPNNQPAAGDNILMSHTTNPMSSTRAPGLVGAVAAAKFARCSVAAVVFAACAVTAFAQTAAPTAAKANPDEVLAHPWVAASSRPAETYFTNLKDGDVVESPFLARFGLSMRGLVPAGHAAGRAGHHHLLINQPLPLDFKKPLPFTDKYIHFGKGQMEMLVDLPPGKYELRLLLADQGHIPYFVYSKPLSLTINKRNNDVKPASLIGAPRIELTGLDAGEAVRGPFRVQFHASGFNVGHADAKLPDTGYFRLTVEPAGRKAEVLAFSSGQTEVWLNPPPANYNLQLEFVSNAPGNAVLTKAKPLQINVSNNAAGQIGAL